VTISPPSAQLVGAQWPRLHSRPDYVSSAGQEAIELAESAGLYLDPWQQLVLTDSLGERRDGKWAAFEVGLIVSRQNGKGSVLEARELFGLFLGGERTIVHTSHLFSTSLDAFRRITSLIQNTPDLDRKVNQYRQTTGQEGIELTNGARLRFLARSKGSGRGWPVDLVIWDEAYELTDEHVDALLPTLASRPNPQLWYTSSPVLDSTTGAPLTAMRKRGIAGDPNLAYFEWSAPSGTDLDDRAAWALANPAMGYRISEEFIARERAAMSDEGFARERLCIWPPEGAEWRVIPEADWRAAADSSSVMVDPVAMAAVVSADRAWVSIAAAGARTDGRLHVELVARVGVGDALARITELTERWSPCAWVIDEGGPSKSLAESVAASGIELTKPTMRDVAGAAGALYDGIAGRPQPDPETGLLGADPRVIRWTCKPELEPAFTGAVAGAIKRPLGAGWAWDQLAASVDIGPLIAAGNALWGYATRPPDAGVEALVVWR
jgi:hypothetical protein